MKKKEEKIIQENIISQAMDDLMSDRYAIYAKYVIQDRAIPDVRDGLKPVQRRIIYSMFTTGNLYNKPNKKCAKIVGDVMGRFHPHGDSSIYDALTRMSQSWKMREPLISFQGNNGSIDNDPAAAYRYTEAKLNKLSENLVTGLEKKVIDFTLNFSDEELEPLVLPARYPNLFVNGSEGIAVAIATEIPPHNLTEMCNAAIYRIKNKSCGLDELLEIVKGPDFPTGGIVFGDQGIKEMYSTGRGKFEISSKCQIVEYSDRNEIVVSEIPYNVVKQDLVFSIDRIRKNKEVDGINEVKDLSSGDDINIVIELKKDANASVILQYLMNKTQLKISYSANIVAISDKHPKTFGLIEYLDEYIAFLREINLKESKFDYDKCVARAHIVDGFISANSIIDKIVELIRTSRDKEDSRTKLMEKFKFSYEQAEAILNLRLYKLSHYDVQVYVDERKDLTEEIARLDNLINNSTALDKHIINSLNLIIKEFHSDRKTSIEEKVEEISIDKRDLISKEDVYVSLTRDGYIKRSSIKSYKASDSINPGIKEGDSLVLCDLLNTMDYILAFTNLGNFLLIGVHEIVENKWKEEGKHVNYLCNLPLNELIIKAIVVRDFTKNVSIGLVSKNGQIKKTALSEFNISRRSKPVTCMKLGKNDEVVDVSVLNNNSNLLILTANGLGALFNENDFSRTGLKTSGVKSVSTLKNNSVVSLMSFRNDEKDRLILLTNHGMYRTFDYTSMTVNSRLGANQKVFKSFKSDPHCLVYATKILDKKQEETFNLLLKNNHLVEIKISDYSLTPIDKYCKKNINELPEDAEIKLVYNYKCNVIDENTVVEEYKENNVVEEEQSFEQISIFDVN